ncbi:MAG: domain S-box/diguanylate cyclase protein [Eubacterium sp.]|jgi:diguanylate cyclase (GGDEF)-like protein/PAS domain S-box-containing protein|nr:domain S-box/diguanylate cyclase protein [Eubacterium sp.]
MKIRLKAFSVVGFSSAIIVLLTLFILKFLIINYIEKQEIEITRHNYGMALTLLQRDEDSLESMALDWSQWDDTYEFIQNRNSRYIEVNLPVNILNSMGLNFILYYNKDLELVYNVENTEESGPELDSILKLNNARVLSALKKGPLTGLYGIGSKNAIVSVAPVTTSDGTAPAGGYLVLGRYIDPTLISYMEEVLRVNLQIVSSQNLEKLKNQGFFQLTYDDIIFLVQKSNENIISYTQLKDIFGSKSLLLVQSMRRDNHHGGMTAVTYFGFFFILALLLITFISIVMIDKLVTNPLRRFHEFMWKVGKTRDTSARINIPGTDEIAELGFLTNNMLQKLDESYEEMKVMKERFKLTLEATNDGYFDANLITNEVDISSTWLKYLGYDEIKGTVDFDRCLENIVYKEERDLLLDAFNQCKNKEADFLRVELRVAKKSKEVLWIVVRGKVVQYDEEGVPVRFICTISDISERKKLEEESIFLSQTDIVTGLKNRAFLEDTMKRSERYSLENTWIIMGDVNGLKLINDSFGHLEGDRLLKTIGTILKDCCPEEDIPARWGGDEFVVYIRDKSEVYVVNLMKSIKKACDRVKDYPIKVSITLGYASRGKELLALNTVLKLAEERMYRHKLLESRSTRSSIIASLEQTLHEKHIETLEHTKRIRKMCVRVGTRMGLTHEELDELVLLGALHDIGKIGIPESILMKPGKLTDEEWVSMKKHTEIGYRIAAATPELAHIADDILYHHERFDGTGYPHGLSGKNIPKLARILSIVDSFDVMTHERVYKNSMGVEEAVAELRKCSGKQFDPEIVELFISSLKIIN